MTRSIWLTTLGNSLCALEHKLSPILHRPRPGFACITCADEAATVGTLSCPRDPGSWDSFFVSRWVLFVFSLVCWGPGGAVSPFWPADVGCGFCVGTPLSTVVQHISHSIPQMFLAFALIFIERAGTL